MPPSLATRLRPMPVALLMVVICVHGMKIVARHEDPQRGSAFAMFSTIDIGTLRKTYATTADGHSVTIPADLAPDEQALVDSPTPTRARALAEKLLQHPWHLEKGAASPGDDLELASVRVRVVTVDGEGLTIHRRVLVDVTVARNAQ